MSSEALFFVTGADAFREIGTWRGFPGLLDRCHFVVVSRPGQPVGGLRTLLPSLAERMIDAAGEVPASPAILLVDAPTAPVSSTAIRERIRNDESIEGMVPRGVADYIKQHSLYREGA
mgnify:CR=1 FL=1